MKNGAVVTRSGFTLNETGQVVDVTPVLGVAFSGKGPAIFFQVRQFEIVEMFFQSSVERIFDHALSGVKAVSAGS